MSILRDKRNLSHLTDHGFDILSRFVLENQTNSKDKSFNEINKICQSYNFFKDLNVFLHVCKKELNED